MIPESFGHFRGGGRNNIYKPLGDLIKVARLLFIVNISPFNKEDIYAKKTLQEQPASQVGREIKNETHPQDNRAV